VAINFSLPEFCVAWTSRNIGFCQETGIPEVNCVVRVVCRADQVLEIERHPCSVLDVLLSDRIHVMNNQTRVNFVAIDTQITAVVSDDGFLAQRSPFPRHVEPLIDPAIESERLAADFASNGEVLKPFLKGFQLNQFGI